MVSQLFSMKAFAAAVSLFSVANAHMMMSSPMPYGKSTLNNSPLAADGSDFPCKQRSGVYDLEGAANNIVIGEPQTLSFIGSAVHGGGSCQVSLTTDQAPTKDSTWMVVHSIEGGCPSNVTGNLDANAAGTGAATFQYTIPQGVAPGQYTIAWSWVNKIGNREFYMNCGPATITAAAKKRYAPAPVSRRQSSFPAMFVANLAGVSNGCATVETFDTEYPDPGASVEKGSINVNFGPPSGCSGSAAEVPAGAPSAAASGAASSVAQSSAAATVAATSAAPGVFASGAAGASSAAPATEATSTAVVSPVPEATGAATSVATAAPAATSAPAGSGSSTPSTTTSAQSGPCTDEGEWYCSADGNSYQRCASGQWSVVMQMATGTTCTPGLSDTFTMNPKAKRHGHARRAHQFGRVAE